MMRRSQSLLSVRVVSYNLLSPNLATTESYPTLKPENLDPSKRLEVVLKKLDEEMTTSSSSSNAKKNDGAILCLQEVSYDWAGALHKFFSNRGYHLVTGLYGRPFNGYMGVAMAWPTARFDTVDVDISRLSDRREGGWPEREKRNKGNCFPLFSFLQSIVKLPLRLLGKKDDPTPIEHWQYSEDRKNVLLTTTLRDKENGNTFCVGNYHMPCAFYAPMVMTIHCDLAARHVQNLAAENPYILAGDWNIKPQDPAYQLLTEAKLKPDDPTYPTPKKDFAWEVSLKEPLRSAYAEESSSGTEPDFTNWGAPREIDGEGFVDTLDYIFLSPHWTVSDVKALPHRDNVDGPFPNLDIDEPSDHMLVAADLELTNSTVQP